MSYLNELEILRDLVEVLEECNIRYAIGGSIASSFYGKVRFTADADITVEPFAPSADRLYETLKSRFYISRQAMLNALDTRSNFNVIHLQTSFKIDLFIQNDTPFQRQFMARCRPLRLLDSSEKSFLVVSPEDIVLLKLQWYLAGGSTSEQQWNDILGVLSVQAQSLDFGYLRKWAASLQLSELLEKCLSESKLT